MFNPDDAIVWEWFDEYQRWRPYSAEVSNFLQSSYAQIKSGGSHTVVPPKLRVYSIDMHNMLQTRVGTGTQRNIRQKVYCHNGAVGKGRIWSFESDQPGVFQTYDFEVAEMLEENYQKNKKSQMDLAFAPCSLPYVIDFKAMTQRRKETGRIRKIKREKKVLGYTKVKNAGGDLAIKSTGQSHLNGLYFPSAASNVGAAAFPHVPRSQQHVFGIPKTTSSSSSSVGASYIPAVKSKTSATSGRVTRSAVKKSNSGNTPTTGNSISAPTGWHPPLVVPGLDVSPLRPSRKKSKAKKTKVAKVKPTLPKMGAIKNTSNTTFPGSGVRSKDSTTNEKDFDRVVHNYFSTVKNPPKDEDCCICMTELTEDSAHNEGCNVVIKMKCSHIFHKSCLSAMYSSGTQDGSIQCPNCKAIYGVKYGNCPAGTMYYTRRADPLPGYPDCGLIEIAYHISPGIQGPEHPSPGERYQTQGFPRVGFLPDNEEGERILRLLIRAWQRRLTFTLGTSVTTGLTNAVVWNEIHHKTETVDRSGHGYPDPNYFSNVTMELASQGVVETDDEKGESESESDEDL